MRWRSVSILTRSRRWLIPAGSSFQMLSEATGSNYRAPAWELSHALGRAGGHPGARAGGRGRAGAGGWGVSLLAHDVQGAVLDLVVDSPHVLAYRAPRAQHA